MNTILEKRSCKDKSNTVQKIFNWIFVCYKCYFDRNDASEGIDVNKASASKECDICRYLKSLQ